MPRCTGLTVRGDQCKRASITGALFCSTHGPAPAPAPAPIPDPVPAAPIARPPRESLFDAEDGELLNSLDPRRQLSGLHAFNRIRTLEDIGEFLQLNVLPRIIELFISSPVLTVRDGALWVLTNLTSVPGEDGARAIFTARPAILDDFVEILVLESPVLAESVLWCLGNIASSGSSYAQHITRQEVHTFAAQSLCDGRQNSRVRKNAAFLLSNLTRYMDRASAVDCLFRIGNMPARSFNDQIVLEDLLWVIYGLYQKADSLEIISLGFFTDLLENESRRILNPVVRLLGDVCAGSNSMLIERFVGCRLVERLQSLLHRRIYTREILWTFSNLSIESFGRKAIMETPGLLLDIIGHAAVEMEAVYILVNLGSKGEVPTINALLQTGAPIMLFHLLQTAIVSHKILICEGLLGILTKGGARAYRLFQPYIHQLVGLQALQDEKLELLIENIRTLMTAYQAVAADVPAVTVALQPAEVVTYRPSLAVTTALARVTLDHSRGAPFGFVNINDLLFTAQDVAYLLRGGHIFTQQGTLTSLE